MKLCISDLFMSQYYCLMDEDDNFIRFDIRSATKEIKNLIPLTISYEPIFINNIEDIIKLYNFVLQKKLKIDFVKYKYTKLNNQFIIKEFTDKSFDYDFIEYLI